jgi:kynurenine formamidase
MTRRPAYRELPLVAPGSDYRHAWDHYPAGDNFGALRNITNAARIAALGSVTLGEPVGLCLPLSEPDPPMFGRQPMVHTVFSKNRNSLDDKLDNFYPQGSTQWDGFRHVRAREHGFFTGVTDGFVTGDTRLGIGHWAGTGIVGRGILFDFGSLCDDALSGAEPAPDSAITASQLHAMGEGLGVRPGDIICLRTGWMKLYQASSPPARAALAASTSWPGLSGGADVAELLWDWGVSAVVADNPSVEVSPGSAAVGSLHRRLIPLLGVPLGELFDFEPLAERCAALGRATFLFVSVPLNLPEGVGSPGNAVAIL